MRIIIGVLLLAPLLLAQETRTATLSNGMKVIVQEDHGIPNVAMYFFYRIGSRNESGRCSNSSINAITCALLKICFFILLSFNFKYMCTGRCYGRRRCFGFECSFWYYNDHIHISAQYHRFSCSFQSAASLKLFFCSS